MDGGSPRRRPDPEPTAGPDPWADAALAAALLAVDTSGLGGIGVRALPGPVRDQWLADLRALLPDIPRRRIPLHITEGRLLGGLDLAATLKAGRPVAERGLLAECDGGLVELAMAERAEGTTVCHLCAALDRGEVVLERDGLAQRLPARLGVVALDESHESDEGLAASLVDRLAFLVDLTPVGVRDVQDPPFTALEIAVARRRLPGVSIDGERVEALCAAAQALGIHSLRAPLHAVRTARIAAALAGSELVTDTELAIAARLVLAPRATVFPAPPPPEEPEPPPEPPPNPDDDPAEEPPERQEPLTDEPLADRILEAARAAIPAHLLAQIQLGALRRSRGQAMGKSGAVRHASLRGRPAGVRRGELRPGDRLNLIETLRAAAPWQRLRRAESAAAPTVGGRPRIEVRRDDFRIARYKQRTETTAIFLVDASGSSALHRLAEAKGAVELLLADCYVRRDRVALVAFRGRGAELLLPPTRSLVRTKRSLADLPGGGGTPLAAGMALGLAVADGVRRRGGTPILVLLTDGRANVARDGTGGRAQAGEDALNCARATRALGISALVVDTSPRPDAKARELAGAMDAVYLPLPHADAAGLSAAVKATAGI
jgi:magnesium chelatase subunit D